ncbi:MAG: hypothetical protein A2X64_06615 [Ignavibacteria bacterium GWF2_33_9]|nr:MAG: hypothetical protein A2X64_06615 [Ignavibacteria bacterium GWF2_33_9]
MKRLPKLSIVLSILVVTFMFGLTSCQKDNPVTTYDNTELNYVSYGNSIEEAVVSDCTLETDFALQNNLTTEEFQNGTIFASQRPDFDFRFIFGKLNLTDEQKEAIKAIMIANRDCERAARIAYHETIQNILQEANQLRREIFAKVRSGEYTRKEAMQEIIALNRATRQKIQESGALEDLRIALRGCTETMIAAIKEILDEEQLEMFERWLESRLDNPGGNTGGTRG